MKQIDSLPINEILCGDAGEVLSHFPPDCIDLTITSPPYGKLRKYKGHQFTFDTFQRIAAQLWRVTALKMAKFLQRKYISIDIAQEYVELANRRLQSIPKAML